MLSDPSLTCVGRTKFRVSPASALCQHLKHQFCDRWRPLRIWQLRQKPQTLEKWFLQMKQGEGPQRKRRPLVLRAHSNPAPILLLIASMWAAIGPTLKILDDPLLPVNIIRYGGPQFELQKENSYCLVNRQDESGARCLSVRMAQATPGQCGCRSSRLERRILGIPPGFD